ncbi:MAG: hypothetical protein IKH13_04455, partial [Clostridia bacterium]|nr:hypothetical protein [Clostridia bacterium]
MKKNITLIVTTVAVIVACALMISVMRSRGSIITENPTETQEEIISETSAEESETQAQTVTETIKAVETTVRTTATTKAPSVFERAKKAITGDEEETAAKTETTTKAAETQTQTSTQAKTETTTKAPETTTKKDVQTSSGVLASDMTINGLRKEGYAVFST